MDEQAITRQDPSTLQYYVKARNGKKRDYIFHYGDSRTCDHPEMVALARGGNVYRCRRCNYAFHINGAYQQPLHNELILAAFVIMNFGKEFGMDSVGEVLRTPIGQHDGSQHKPVLPEGMSFTDVMSALEDVDVTGPDGGKAALQVLLGDIWEAQVPRLSEGVRGDTNNKRRKNLAKAWDTREGDGVPTLPEGTSQDSTVRD
jgi:hypothetical protein